MRTGAEPLVNGVGALLAFAHEEDFTEDVYES